MSSFTRTVPATMWLRAVDQAGISRDGGRPQIDNPGQRWPSALTRLILRMNSALRLTDDLTRWYALFMCIRRPPEEIGYRGGSISLRVTPRMQVIDGRLTAQSVVLHVSWPAESDNPSPDSGQALHVLTLPTDEPPARSSLVWPAGGGEGQQGYRVLPAEEARFPFYFTYERWNDLGRPGHPREGNSACLTIRPPFGENSLDLAVLLSCPEMNGFEQFIVETAHLLQFEIHVEAAVRTRVMQGLVVARSSELRCSGTGPVVFSATFDEERYRECRRRAIPFGGLRILEEANSHGVITCWSSPVASILTPMTILSGSHVQGDFSRALQSIAPGMAVLSEVQNGSTVTVRLVDLGIQRDFGASIQRSRNAGSFSFTGEVRSGHVGRMTMTMGELDSRNLAAALIGEDRTFRDVARRAAALSRDIQEPTVASKPAPIVTQSKRRISNPKRGNKDVPHDDDQRGGNQVHSRTLRRSRRTGE